MPFRAGAPFLLKVMYLGEANVIMYQCPFGLGLHFYADIDINAAASEAGINALSG